MSYTVNPSLRVYAQNLSSNVYVRSNLVPQFSCQPLNSLDLSTDRAPTIQPDGRSVHIRTSPATQEQASTSHILRATDPAQRDAALDLVTESLQRLGHHLALERTTSQRVGSKDS